VADPNIDPIDICAPNDMHFDIAMAAIQAGKHVHCEKPLANSAELALWMTEAAERRGVTTLVGFNYIQNPEHGLARAMVRRGDIGGVTYGAWSSTATSWPAATYRTAGATIVRGPAPA
jgi:predicted dehydrogenase